MMKKQVLPVLLAVLIVLTMVVGCGKKGQTKNLTDAPLTGEVVADFSNGMPETMFASDGWCNGNPFNVYWKSNCVTFADGEMHLAIKDGGDGWEYYGGEARSNRWYGYGDYEVCMKPAKVTGTASTFFTCTGPYDIGEDGNPHRHDEIDIEFLGKNTKGVQFNYFVDGKGGHEYWYDLGFDASEEYHTYGFRWEENAITWFVDGTPVYKVERAAGEPFPEMPGRILCNYWSGTIEAIAWMGAYSQNDTTADYKWVRTTASSIDLNPKTEATESDAEASEDAETENATEIDWSQIDAVVPAFESSNGKHTITVDGTAANIVYTDAVCDWSNISMGVPAEAADTDTLHLVVKNNGTSDTNKYRIDVLENGKCINRSATWNGNPIYTDLEWGGSFIDNLPAGAEAEVAIRYAGTPDSVVIMLDTMHQGDDTAYSGDVTISEVKFASAGAVAEQSEQQPEEEPEQPEQQPAEEPADPNASVLINGQALTFTQEGDPKAYDVTYDPETNSVRAVYTDVPGNSYKNLYGNLKEANDNNTFTAKIANNGQNPVKIRADIVSNTQVANGNAANTYAEQDGAEVFTDLEWGGSMFTVQPGMTSDIRVEYDPARDVTGILFYLDSATYDDPELHSGDVTILDFALSNEESHAAGAAAEQPAADVNQRNNHQNNQNQTNQNQNDALLVNGNTVQFTQDGTSYNVNYSNGLNVSYDNLPGASYKTLYADVSGFVGDNDTLETTVTNNGTEPITVRVDVESNTHVNETNAANTSATQNGSEVYTDTTYGGSTFVIQPGETANLKIRFDAARGTKGVNLYFDSATWGDENTHSGNVTVSGMSFSKTEAQNGGQQGGSEGGQQGGSEGGQQGGSEGGQQGGSEGGQQGGSEGGNAATGASINGNSVSLTGSDAYTVTYGDSTTVTYSDLGGNSYSTLYGDCSEFIGDSNLFSTTVTNNGEAPVTIRIDIASNTTVSNTDAANVSATQDGNGVYTDTTWGGSTFTIQPGESANLAILFDPDRQAKGVTMYFDSSTWDDENTHTGSVTISDMTFSTAQES